MSMNLQDVERLQALYPEHQVELRTGKLILTGPSDGVSGIIGARFGWLLANWVYGHDLGWVFNSNTGFQLPNGDLLSPSVSFMSRTQLKSLPRTYLAVVPELIVEIKSSRDRIRELEGKISLFLRQGVQVGILIDPDKKTVTIFRSAGITTGADEEAILQKTTLQDSDMLAIPELFPGWEIPITNLWPSIYE